MKREILIEGKPFKFALKRASDKDSVFADGKTHSVRFSQLPDGRRQCIVDGRVIEWSGPNGNNVRLVRSGGRLHHLQVQDPRRARRAGLASGVAGGTTELVAPMPGRVVAVLKEAGQEIEAGKGIVVLEAMKMENELRSPISGVVKVLKVESGQSVETGQLIAVVEPSKQD
ncbi:MAG TPA: acetyl-CoA carboxylase biotin carboxyl carrier protein subunit [Acidobacteriota bacterium]|nr:acetyl-CoA carboxylase biotin carboxyl carrier protein subunit [Acidobacteriota bacterium]